MAVSNYGNESISVLNGADRVRKRPGVIFGSDGLEGCEHTVVEILSNSIDEAREGYGDTIILTTFEDGSIQVEDFGRGCPVDWNEKEQRFNWELVFCELYAGGKYSNMLDGNYEYSLGLNGLGSCATQYSSEYMDVEVRRDGKKYRIHFEKGDVSTIDGISGLHVESCLDEPTGTKIKWKPDLEVFTDIDIPSEYYQDILKKQAVINKGIVFLLREQKGDTSKETRYCYENGIVDYATEIVGSDSITKPYYIEGEKSGRDRDDMPDYNVKMSAAFCFSTKINSIEYYHNSSWLEHGGAPEKAVKSGFVYALDEYIQKNNKYKKNESKITFADVQDSLVLITNCFSTQTSYENQTKKSITNKFIQQAMTEFFKDNLRIYLIENSKEADRIINQILVNKRSRESAEKTRINIKKKLSSRVDISNRVQKFVDCRSKDVSKREVYICLKGDTKVKLLDGTDRTIESLVGETDVWAYSTDEIGRMIPAKILQTFKTRDAHNMLKITFEDGSSVECTPEHRFLDKDTLSWVEAQDVVEGQSIASMKFQTKTTPDNTPGWLEVWVPDVYTAYNTKNWKKQGKWQYVHRRVASYLGISQEYDGEHRMHIHHIDENKYNNDPSNLEFLTLTEHRRKHNITWHASGLQKQQFDNMSEESRKRMHEGVYHRTPEGVERQKEAARKMHQEHPEIARANIMRYNNSPKFWEDVERNRILSSKRAKDRWASLSDEEKMEANERNRQGQYRRYKIQCIHIGQNILDQGLEVNEANWKQFKPELYPTYSTMLKHFESVDKFIEEVRNYNLRVVSVEKVYYESAIPVYCLTIDSEFHSFVLDNGVITHNCEGDSAAGSLRISRDAEFQGVMPVRGKILNCMKAGYDRIFASDIITDLIRVLGCGVDIPGRKASKDLTSFDIEKLKWDKVIICTDADVDGFQIRTLILSMLYRLTPGLIDAGKVFIAETPLYEIICKDKTYFAYSDGEKNQIVKSLGNVKMQINRSKGLGENDPDMMWLTTMNPATRKLIKVEPSDAEETARVFDLLLGDNLAGRKQHIADVGSKYLDQLDIS